MIKYYFEKNTNNNTCYQLQHFQEIADREQREIEVVEAKRVTDNSLLYCVAYGVPFSKSDSACGKRCEFYSPNNKTNGRCELSAVIYERSVMTRVVKPVVKEDLIEIDPVIVQ